MKPWNFEKNECTRNYHIKGHKPDSERQMLQRQTHKGRLVRQERRRTFHTHQRKNPPRFVILNIYALNTRTITIVKEALLKPKSTSNFMH